MYGASNSLAFFSMAIWKSSDDAGELAMRGLLNCRFEWTVQSWRLGRWYSGAFVCLLCYDFLRPGGSRWWHKQGVPIIPKLQTADTCCVVICQEDTGR
jgi:hypothetical protein